MHELQHNSIVQDIPQKPENITDELSNNERLLEKLIADITLSSYSGPLPPAKELKAYADILSSAPDRIFAMAEKEQDYRMERFRHIDNYKKKGQLSALIVIVSSFSLSAFLAYIGNPWTGAFISVSAVASIAITFICGERNKKQ